VRKVDLLDGVSIVRSEKVKDGVSLIEEKGENGEMRNPKKFPQFCVVFAEAVGCGAAVVLRRCVSSMERKREPDGEEGKKREHVKLFSLFLCYFGLIKIKVF
jgi:hypothetical protein